MHWLLWTLALFVIIFLRYLAVSGGYHWFFRARERWRHRVFSPREPDRDDLRRDVRRSALVSVIFAAFGIGVLYLWSVGSTTLYEDWSARPWYWLVLGPALFIFGQETYYYWVHRWMHRPGVYERVHRWHHETIETTAWTAFSFHPLEALLQAAFPALFVLLVPIQTYLFLGLLGLMTLSATINHAGVEVFPASWARLPGLRWLIGATHHDLHHRQANTNFGLYLTWWDEWMGTENGKFTTRFGRFTRRG